MINLTLEMNLLGIALFLAYLINFLTGPIVRKDFINQEINYKNYLLYDSLSIIIAYLFGFLYMKENIDVLSKYANIYYPITFTLLTYTTLIAFYTDFLYAKINKYLLYYIYIVIVYFLVSIDLELGLFTLITLALLYLLSVTKAKEVGMSDIRVIGLIYAILRLYYRNYLLLVFIGICIAAIIIRKIFKIETIGWLFLLLTFLSIIIYL